MNGEEKIKGQRGGKLPTKRTTAHVTRPHNPEGTQKGRSIKTIDNSTGKVEWIDGSPGIGMDSEGDVTSDPKQSLKSSIKYKKPRAGKV